MSNPATSGAPGLSHLPSHTTARLACVVAAHLVVDLLSAVIIPILSVLEGRLSMSPSQGALLIASGSVSSGLIQPVVALVSDRFDTRWLGTVGFLAAAVCVGLVGYAQSFEQLLILQIIAAAGIGAFHPVGAAGAGQLGGLRRARAISTFYAAGLAGGVMGAVLVPQYVKHMGVEALIWMLPLSVPFIIALMWGVHGVAHRSRSAHAEHAALSAAERSSRWRDVWLLYSANALRFIVNMMLATLLIRWSELVALDRAGATVLDQVLRTEASKINGSLQAVMAGGMGVSGLLMGLLIPQRLERVVLIALPLIGSVAILLFPVLAPSDGGNGPANIGLGVVGAAIVAFLAGVGYAGVMPLTITMAQRLLPHRTSLASGLMMGGAWSLAACGPPLVQWMLGTLTQQTGSKTTAMAWCFVVVASLLAMSGLLGIPLGRRAHAAPVPPPAGGSKAVQGDPPT